jgi:hypothetical protein
MRRALAALLLLASCTLPTGAWAQQVAGGHLAYAPGYGFGHHTGFRHQLDLGVMFRLRGDRVGSKDGLWSRGSGLVAGPALQTAFGRSPTTLMGEFGYGADTTLASVAILGGPAVRLYDGIGAGGTARIAADILFVQVGLRVGLIVLGQSEANACLTLGIGRF